MISVSLADWTSQSRRHLRARWQSRPRARFALLTNLATTSPAKIVGIVSEIDVQKTLMDKIGVEIEPQLILGACNPRFAHRALQVEPSIGGRQISSRCAETCE